MDRYSVTVTVGSPHFFFLCTKVFQGLHTHTKGHQEGGEKQFDTIHMQVQFVADVQVWCGAVRGAAGR